MKQYFILFLTNILFIFCKTGYSQNLFQGIEANYKIEKNNIYENPNFHLTVKPFNLNEYQYSDTNENNIFTKNLFEFSGKNYEINFNPVVKSFLTYDVENKNLFSDNRIGFSSNFYFADKFYFSGLVFISKIKLPDFQADFSDNYNIIPHYGKFLNSQNGYYNFFSGSFSFAYNPVDYLYFETGINKHFLGNGYRSLFLSNNSNVYPYFKISVDIWKFKYIWFLSFLKDNNLFGIENKPDIYSKYTFTHYLSLNLTDRINLDFFETIITNPYDSVGRKGIEISYFNPVILYRPVEASTGTYDNALMGTGLNIRLWKAFYLYSQFVLDDIIISEITAKNGWWANKYGFQFGIKSYNFLNLKNLFFLSEMNYVTPYTYSHGRDNINYGTHRQALAHPFGANFREFLSIIKYDYKRFSIKTKIVFAQYGADNDSTSYGNDIYKTYELREDDYGNFQFQGEKTKFQYYEIKLSYLINPKYNLQIEAGFVKRKKYNNFLNEKDNFIFVGISSNIFNENFDY